MNGFALGLILISAVIHASWNLLAKRVAGGASFVWLFTAMSCVLYAPVGIWILMFERPSIGTIGWAFIFASALLRLLYFMMLQRGYRTGDLSLVYPLARGTGPTLATLAAIVLLHERPSAIVLFGAGLVIFGVVLLTSTTQNRNTSHPRAAITYGFLCGVFIASYTVCDKYAVSAHESAVLTLDVPIPPLMLQVFSNLGITLMLTPTAFKNWDTVTTHWAHHRWAVVGIAVMYPAAYTLVLWAMSFTDLSYVASAREVSILFGTFLGTRLLGEGLTRRRLTAIVVIVAGLITLAAN